MQSIKRQQIDDTDRDYNNNKKIKIDNEIQINTVLFRSHFEDLANEIFYEIFEYLDIYDVYQGFLKLNRRFENFLLRSNLPIQINISTMPKSKFEHYHQTILIPNKHRINLLRLSNPFTVDLVFSPPRLICKFLSLQTLILDNINAKYLTNILTQAMLLPQLHSLVLHLADHIEYLSALLLRIFRLPKLKSCQMTYQLKGGEDQPLVFNEPNPCSIEHLEIHGRFPFEKFDHLLACLPRLRHISIDCLDESLLKKRDVSPVPMQHMKSISLTLDEVHFNRFEQLIKYSFPNLQVLRLTIKSGYRYLNAQKWEEIIVSSMPKLRIFDVSFDESVYNDTGLTYHDVIKQFNTSFWIEKQWFFTHEHDWRENINSGRFYSTNPYRRRDYQYDWQLDKPICSDIRATKFNSVQHVQISCRGVPNNCIHYFPNATELTIKEGLRTSDYSILTSLNRTLSLKQLTKLVIDAYFFPFEQVIHLLYFTPHVHTFKYSFLSLNTEHFQSMKNNHFFQYVSTKNRIKNLDLDGVCTLEIMQLMMNLFPQVQYLQTQMKRKEIEQIIRYLLTKNNPCTRRLFFLCLCQTPKICLKELNTLIQSEYLLEHYLIKFVNRDLYLWW